MATSRVIARPSPTCFHDAARHSGAVKIDQSWLRRWSRTSSRSVIDAGPVQWFAKPCGLPRVTAQPDFGVLLHPYNDGP